MTENKLKKKKEFASLHKIVGNSGVHTVDSQKMTLNLLVSVELTTHLLII